MPIRPFLADEAFDQETITAMSAALEDVCAALGLSRTDDPATRMVAERIIQYAKLGVRDVAMLSEMTLVEFKQE